MEERTITIIKHENIKQNCKSIYAKSGKCLIRH